MFNIVIYSIDLGSRTLVLFIVTLQTTTAPTSEFPLGQTQWRRALIILLDRPHVSRSSYSQSQHGSSAQEVQVALQVPLVQEDQQVLALLVFQQPQEPPEHPWGKKKIRNDAWKQRNSFQVLSTGSSKHDAYLMCNIYPETYNAFNIFNAESRVYGIYRTKQKKKNQKMNKRIWQYIKAMGAGASSNATKTP